MVDVYIKLKTEEERVAWDQEAQETNRRQEEWRRRYSDPERRRTLEKYHARKIEQELARQGLNQQLMEEAAEKHAAENQRQVQMVIRMYGAGHLSYPVYRERLRALGVEDDPIQNDPNRVPPTPDPDASWWE